MKRIKLRQPSRVNWLGGGGGGGNAAGDAATQFQFNKDAAQLGRQLNQYNIDSPQGTTRFQGNTLVERLTKRGKKVFDTRERADLELSKNALRQSQEANAFLGRNAGRLGELRQSELGAAESRAGTRERLLGEIRGQTAFDPRQVFSDQGVSDLSNVDRYGQREQDLGRKSVEDALFSRLNPQFDRDRGALESRLAAQGITTGSQAYSTATDELNRNMTDARFQAVLAGGQEQSRQEGLRQTELGRRRGTRQQLFEELLAQRGIPYQELAQIEG